MEFIIGNKGKSEFFKDLIDDFCLGFVLINFFFILFECIFLIIINYY